MNGCSLVQVCAFCIMSAYLRIFVELILSFTDWNFRSNIITNRILQNSVSQSWKNFSGHRSCRGYIFFWHITLNMEIRIFPGILRFGENHGLTCPQYLLFPPYCCGRFQSGKSTMLVSAGLGEHTIPIRLHNPRELLVIEFCPSAHKEDSHKTGRKTANGNTGKN